MRLLEMLQKPGSKTQVNKILKYIGDDKGRFAQLIQYYLNGPYRITQRAALPLSYCAINHPKLIKPNLKRIIQFAALPEATDSIKRNTMRLLQFIDVPKALEGSVTDMAFRFLSNPAEAIAIRVFSMTVLTNMAIKFPELKNELILMLEQELPYASAGFRSRATKSLRILKN